MLKKNNWLSLILLIFFIKGIFLAFLIPPWEAPDEPGHLSYPIYLLDQKKLPSAFRPFIPMTIIESIKNNRKIINQLKKGRLLKKNKSSLFNRDKIKYSKQLTNLASHPPIYYLYLMPFYLLSIMFSSYMSLILLRIGSLLLGTVSLIFIYRLTKKIFSHNKKMPLITVFLISFQPTFSFISSIVNNDIMVFLIFVIFLDLMISFSLSKNIFGKRLIVLTFVASIAPLIKPQLITLVFTYIVFLFIWNKKKLLLNFFLSLLAIIPISGWFIYKYIEEGIKYFSYSVQNIKIIPYSFWCYPFEFILGKQPIGIFMSFWGFFGWLDVPLPKWCYLLFFLIILISLIGWICWLKKEKLKTVRLIYQKKTIFLLLIANFLYIVSIFLFDLQVFIMAHRFVIHGRYLTPVLPLFTILILQGILFYKTALRKKFIIFVSIVFIVNQITTFMIISYSYYGTFMPKLMLLDIYTLR